MLGGNRLFLFFAVNSFAQGMLGVLYEPLSYLLKDGLGLNAGQSAAFVAVMTASFLGKPLWGLLTDFLPFGGRLRRPHLIFSSFLGTASLLALALGPEKPSYRLLLALMTLLNAATVFSDVICDGLMVQSARSRGGSLPLQAVQIGMLYLTLVATGLGGGWLSAHLRPRLVFGLACLLPLLGLASAFWIKEEAVAARPRGPGAAGLGRLLASRRFWSVSLVIFLWSFTPLFGTAQFYFQSEHLRFDPVFIGFLSTLGGIFGALGAAAAGRAALRGLSLEKLLYAGVWLGGCLHLLYLFYGGPWSAAAITALSAFAGVIFRLALMDLAARSCPLGGEATAFAIYMSVFNLAAWASNTIGGKLYGMAPGPAAAAGLCALAAAAVFLSWPLVVALRKNINCTASVEESINETAHARLDCR